MEEIKEFFQELIVDGFATTHHSQIVVEDGLEIKIASQPNLGAYVFIPWERDRYSYPSHYAFLKDEWWMVTFEYFLTLIDDLNLKKRFIFNLDLFL